MTCISLHTVELSLTTGKIAVSTKTDARSDEKYWMHASDIDHRQTLIAKKLSSAIMNICPVTERPIIRKP